MDQKSRADAHQPDADQFDALRDPVVDITTAEQFREAVTRLRFLESAAQSSSLGRQRAALERAVASYLISRHR